MIRSQLPNDQGDSRQMKKEPTYHGLLRTIAGQEVWITLHDGGSHWNGLFGTSYDKNTGEDDSGFGVLDINTVVMLAEVFW